MVPSVQPDETYQVQFGTSPPLRKFIRPSFGKKAVCVRSRGRWDIQLELPRTERMRKREERGTREDTSSTFKVVSYEVERTDCSRFLRESAARLCLSTQETCDARYSVTPP